jgi:hypothetical protein
MQSTKNHIANTSFDVLEEVVLSGQMDHCEIVSLLDQRPDFAAWYEKRAEGRLARSEWVAEAAE